MKVADLGVPEVAIPMCVKVVVVAKVCTAKCFPDLFRVCVLIFSNMFAGQRAVKAFLVQELCFFKEAPTRKVDAIFVKVGNALAPGRGFGRKY